MAGRCHFNRHAGVTSSVAASQSAHLREGRQGAGFSSVPAMMQQAEKGPGGGFPRGMRPASQPQAAIDLDLVLCSRQLFGVVDTLFHIAKKKEKLVIPKAEFWQKKTMYDKT